MFQLQDKTPRELCISIGSVLRYLTDQEVSGEPDQLLQELLQVKGITLQMVQEEIINRVPESLRTKFISAVVKTPQMALVVGDTTDDVLQKLLQEDIDQNDTQIKKPIIDAKKTELHQGDVAQDSDNGGHRLDLKGYVDLTEEEKQEYLEQEGVLNRLANSSSSISDGGDDGISDIR